jgi:D-alanyl-lipoteichoic acid acyltransferase DltB (MBOAT superfamily)
MLFNSLSFYVFFPIVTAGYFLLPHRWRWAWLLAASAYFYMSFIPVYILILGVTILVDYVAGIVIERSEGRRRKAFLILSIVANLGMLGFFKYFNFLNTNLAGIAHWLDWNYPIPALNILLPIGLSFHTFQSMAYTIEVYRGKQKAERHLGILALYVLFYPQLVAGPIERPGHMLPQFHEEHHFDYTNAADGLRLMAWGFFKKLVIADRLALLVDPIYSDPRHYPGPLLLLAMLAIAYQVYCDFSGYSDIAIGAARVMGFRLMTNFDRPFSARSMSEFWTRWNISLSSWFRDYFYISLGGNRVSRPRWYLNIFLTFLASGLWHGASWNFVIWGGLHGLFVLIETWTANLRAALSRLLPLNRLPALQRIFQNLTVFLLVAFACIFFRAASLSDALYISGHLFHGYDLSQLPLWMEQIRVTLGKNFPLAILFTSLTGGQVLLIMGLQILFLEIVQFLQKDNPVERIVAGQNALIRWGAYYFLLANILFFGAFQQTTFIYFQF